MLLSGLVITSCILASFSAFMLRCAAFSSSVSDGPMSRSLVACVVLRLKSLAASLVAPAFSGIDGILSRSTSIAPRATPRRVLFCPRATWLSSIWLIADSCPSVKSAMSRPIEDK